MLKSKVPATILAQAHAAHLAEHASAEFSALTKIEVAKWGKVVKAAKISLL